MDTIVAELVSFLQAVKSGSLIACLISVAFVLIGSASVIVALLYRRTLSERRQIAWKATQENFEVIAAELRKRALEMKERDDELRKRETRERPQQQQALKEQQRILKQSVSHAITLGLRGDQNRLLEIDLKGMLSAFQGKRNSRDCVSVALQFGKRHPAQQVASSVERFFGPHRSSIGL